MSIPKTTHTGKLEIGNMVLPCSVLSDGTRILTQTDFMKGMGMYYSGWISKHRPSEDIAAEIPQFLSFKNLKPFVDKHLGDLQSIDVKYRTARGRVSRGIKASIIPKICDVWIDAEEMGNIGVRQKKIAAKAKVLMRALAHVGIIALVDEATGYQEIRDREALQAILDKHLLADRAKWSKRFPDDFYKQMFRLRGWEWQGMKVNRPSVVGRYTNDFVWDRMAPGIRKELERLNPKTDKGTRRARHHQWLTDDIGHPALQSHLSGVLALLRASSGWDQFKRMLQRAYPKVNTNLDLPFDTQD